MSFDVTLSKDVLPEYPAECIACGKSDPRSRIRTTSHSARWWTWLFLTPGSKFVAEAPACHDCALTFASRRRRHTIGRLVVCALTTVPATFVLLAWIRPDGLVAAFAALLDPRFWITVICSALFVYFPLDLIRKQLFGRIPFDVVAFGKVVTYEFTDRQYAEEFGKLNGTNVDDPDEPFWQWTKKRT